MEGDSIREMFKTCKHVTLFNGVRLGEMDLICFATAFDLNDLPDSTGDLRRIRDQYHKLISGDFTKSYSMYNIG